MTKKYVSAMVIIILLAVLTGSVILLCVRNPEVHFSRKDAFQEEAFDLTLSAGIRGGTIYYTLNGDTPTTSRMFIQCLSVWKLDCLWQQQW